LLAGFRSKLYTQHSLHSCKYNCKLTRL
jgi:hypothetical protein